MVALAGRGALASPSNLDTTVVTLADDGWADEE